MSETKKQKMTPENPRIIALFDVDGTLTIPRGGEWMMWWIDEWNRCEDIYAWICRLVVLNCISLLLWHITVEVTPEMMQFMKSLSEKITVGIVGGSDLPKQEEQLGEGIAKVFPYNFSQNGLVAYKNGELQEIQTISKHLGEDNIRRIVNWTLKYLADIDIPVKRGTFIEFRSGMMNISPIGRNCSREERNDYEKIDLEQGIRKNMVAAMKKEFADL